MDYNSLISMAVSNEEFNTGGIKEAYLNDLDHTVQDDMNLGMVVDERIESDMDDVLYYIDKAIEGGDIDRKFGNHLKDDLEYGQKWLEENNLI